ncbi:MAG: acyltransferase [Acidimicrobiaceae bacterium]|nr:acyltransferase [Acidimicrobiaceae bacterium]
MKAFRRDIQSLRGVALLFVVAYHARLGLSSGFVGVDIFFVISGFVITSHLLDNRSGTALQIAWKFIVRRFWRLVPVVLVGVLATLAVSLVVLSPFGEQQPVIRTGWWSIAFLGNIELMLHANYWATPQNPLLHIWSLGVEGQLYLGILVLVTTLIYFDSLAAQSRRSNHLRWLSFAIVIAICVSFMLSLASSYDLSAIPIAREFAFYGSPTRAWEFLFGGLLASQQIRLTKLSKRSANYLGVIGWLGILVGLVIINPASPFPGWVALLPVLGTTAVIAAGGSGHQLSWMSDLQILQRIGDISYSWYVVHLPVLIFLEILFPNNSIPQRLAWVGLSYLLSLAMFLGVEKPMRRLSLEGRRRQLKVGFSLVGTSLLVMLLIGQGSAMLRSSGQLDPFYSGVRDEVKLLGVCLNSSIPDDIRENCVWNTGNNTPRLILLGDSQAASLASGAIKAADLVGAEIAVHSQGGCPLISPSVNNIRCPSWNDRWRAIRNYQPDVLIVSNNWSSVDSDYIEDLVVAILAEQLPTIFVQEAPYLGSSRQSLASKFLFHSTSVPSDPAIRDASLDALIRHSGINNMIQVFDPETVLCPKTRCLLDLPALRGVFYGQGHLSRTGSDLLAPNLAELISKLLKTRETVDQLLP